MSDIGNILSFRSLKAGYVTGGKHHTVLADAFASACEGELIEYAKKARAESANNPLSLDVLEETEASGEPQIVYSCLPWVDITMCSNERNYDDPKLKDDTVPMFVWGKYTERDGRYRINMTLEVNHRVIDGYYVGQFVQNLEALIADLA